MDDMPHAARRRSTPPVSKAHASGGSVVRQGTSSGPAPTEGLLARIGRKETRRLRAHQRKDRAPWIALGLYGVVGWSIVLPTLAGIALGVWIDATWPGGYSWTLMLLALGLCAGCWNAWRWVSLEQQAIRDDAEEGQDVPGSGDD